MLTNKNTFYKFYRIVKKFLVLLSKWEKNRFNLEFLKFLDTVRKGWNQTGDSVWAELKLTHNTAEKMNTGTVLLKLNFPTLHTV